MTTPLRSLLIVVLFGFIAGTVAVPVSAQTSDAPIFDEFHTWWDFATIYKWNDQWRYDGDYGTRGVLTDDNWWLLYLRPSVRYKPNSWFAAHGGLALFYNFFDEGYDLPELRPWLGARFTWPTPGHFLFTHYFRAEYRAFYLKETDRWDDWVRGRYQLQMVTPRFSIGGADGFFTVWSAELFEDFSSDDGFGDRFRFNAGIARSFNKSFRVDLNYVFHTLQFQLLDEDTEFDDHVVRLRFFYHFN